MYGLAMEKIFLLPGLKKEGLFLTLVQFAFYTLLAQLEMLYRREKRHIPMKTYVVLASATLTTMSLSNASLGYLNYPIQVVFKSCKLIPVLIGGILLQRKRFSPLDFSAATLMCLGLSVFTLADSQVHRCITVKNMFDQRFLYHKGVAQLQPHWHRDVIRCSSCRRYCLQHAGEL